MSDLKIFPCIWFNDNAEQAVNDYCSVFKNSGIDVVNRCTESQVEVSQRPLGSVLSIGFHLDGQDFLAINGGPVFQPTPGLSLVINCDTQAEIDRIWDKLTAGGQAMSCGWVTDKYGVTWQVVPRSLARMMKEGTDAQIESMMKALMPMEKLDMQLLINAYSAK